MRLIITGLPRGKRVKVELTAYQAETVLREMARVEEHSVDASYRRRAKLICDKLQAAIMPEGDEE